MNQTRWQEIENLFNTASQLPAGEQARFVTDSCRGDVELREEVLSLLEQMKKNAIFLEDPILTEGFRLLNYQGKEASLRSGQKLGYYKILRPIGSGGMGEVYLAEDERLSRKVALKILPAFAAENKENTTRFRQEALAASKVVHPNVAHIYEFDSVADESTKHFITMEYVEGKTLRQLIRQATLNFSEIIEIASQIGRAIAAAHSAGVIHRDIKPENIIITEPGDERKLRVKVLDFGLAKLNENLPSTWGSPSNDFELKTTPGLLMGTTAYMSPEQVRGEAIDKRTDIWSLGVVLYEMLMGDVPFKGNSPAEIAAGISNDKIKESEDLRERFGSNLTRIVNRCLAKNADHRFQSAQDLVFALENPEDPSVPYFSFSWARQKAKPVNWTFYLFGGVFLLGIIILFAVLSKNNSPFFSVIGGGNSTSAATENVVPNFNQITFRRGTIWNARFSPGSQSVFYSASWNGEKLNIFSARQTGTESRSFNLEGVNLLSVSAQGEIALLKSEKYLYQFIQRGTLERMPVEGTVPRSVAENVQEADFSPDGENLAISRWASGRNLLEYPIGKVLYDTPGYISSPRVSPDGQSVAFLDHPKQWDNRGFVAIIDRLGNKKIITDEWSGVEGLAWNPLTEEVWFTASKAGEAYALYAASGDGTGRTRLVSRIPGNLMLYDISQNGQVLLSRAFQSTDVYSISSGETAARNLSWLRLVGIGDLAADGSTFIFTHFGEGSGSNYAVYLRKTDGSPAVRLGEGRALALSPDKRYVIAKLNEPEQLNILPVNAGEVRVLPRGSIEQFDGAEWLPDGQRIIFTGNLAGQDKRTFIEDLQTEEIRPLTPTGITGTLISPDGSKIVVQNAEGEKSIFSINENKLSEIKNLSPEDEVIGWSLDNETLFVFDPFSLPIKIEQLNMKSGKRKIIKTIAPSDTAGVFGPPYVFITPDAKACLYGIRRYLFDLFVTENLN